MRKDLLQSGHNFEFARKPKRTGLELVTVRTKEGGITIQPILPTEKDTGSKNKPTTTKTVKTSKEVTELLRY